jgi:serine/threonine protein kinase
MEYCAGGDLALHLSRLGTFKEPTTRLIIRELILAMEHLHQLDILYRDLKPENILLGIFEQYIEILPVI